MEDDNKLVVQSEGFIESNCSKWNCPIVQAQVDCVATLAKGLRAYVKGLDQYDLRV